MKKFCLEEWNKIEPKKYFKNFEAKIKLCKEINGERLNEYNLRKIRQKAEKEAKMEVKKENTNKIQKKLKRVFNENVLKKLKNNEIKELEKRKKDLANYYDEKIENKKEKIDEEKRIEKMSGKKAKSDNQANLELLKITKEQELKEAEKKIKDVKMMTIYKYLKYFLQKESKVSGKVKKNFKKNKSVKVIKNEKNNKIKQDDKNNKMAIEEEIEDNYDEETRDEVRNTMKPILELEKLQEENEEICYNFEF